jgi:hypothetical protein
MPTSTAVSVSERVSHSVRQRLSRAALTAAATVGLLVASRTAAAQTPVSQANAWELRVTSGAFVPTGSQRNVVKDAQVTAAQLSWLVRPSFALTGTFGWARSRDLETADTPKLDVFTYDLGGEARGVEMFAGRRVTLSPFVGAGAGARSYNYRKLDVAATHNVAAYGTVGGELGMGRVGLRLEVRDYLAGFKPLTGAGRSDVRNDVVMMVGLRFDRQRASQN